MKNFVLIGAGGYVAPRHMKAIKETGNNLRAALDRHDSVGILDAWFPEADFFTEFERFDRHIDKMKRSGTPVDFVSVCTPNYLHDAHIRFGLKNGADVICEKPVVLNPWNVDALIEMEKETGKNIYTVLQLRLHKAIAALKKKIDAGDPAQVHEVDLQYVTSRGHWYHTSWKGDMAKGGGISTNIGVHFFDMLTWIFGDVKKSAVTEHSDRNASGILELEKANVRWFLSIDAKKLPADVSAYGKTTYRALKINGAEIDFSTGFDELHTEAYAEIIAGNGVRIAETKPVIQLLHDIRNFGK